MEGKEEVESEGVEKVDLCSGSVDLYAFHASRPRKLTEVRGDGQALWLEHDTRTEASRQTIRFFRQQD